ncbi:hypothetical protein QAD02_012413 [Eretmocerus hayati]|uniref:Uncharacterized protein n=1 Tax=Eretmocerus hayati TaxID=131215 RepID=A0ACC2NZL2_9HYME|nr:hypothetical protein QAD02_012413 [Eretmocerus hayati]
MISALDEFFRQIYRIDSPRLAELAEEIIDLLPEEKAASLHFEAYYSSLDDNGVVHEKNASGPLRYALEIVKNLLTSANLSKLSPHKREPSNQNVTEPATVNFDLEILENEPKELTVKIIAEIVEAWCLTLTDALLCLQQLKDHRDGIGLLLLTYLIKLTYNSKLTESGDTWRPSQKDISQAFIVRLKRHEDLPVVTEKLEIFQVEHYQASQPYIVFCADLNDLKSCHVIYHGLIYDFTKPIDAADFIFKVLYVLKLDFN